MEVVNTDDNVVWAVFISKGTVIDLSMNDDLDSIIDEAQKTCR